MKRTSFRSPAGRRKIAYMKRELRYGRSPKEIAEDFNCSERFVYRIRAGECYAHIPPAILK